MIEKSFDEIEELDLKNLVENKVLESRRLEYKSEISLNQVSEKKEFLADVSSFANAVGGDLIFGIKDDSSTGEPKSLDGCKIQNVDSEILKIENLIRDGLNPRIWDLKIKSIQLSNSDYALLVRIPNSWNSPHRVDFKGHDKFYTRGSNGKYPMDVDQLRVAFNLSDTLNERIRTFRIERINNIYTDQTYIPIGLGPKLVLHIIPYGAFASTQTFDLRNSHELSKKLILIGSGGWDSQYNLEGFITHGYNSNYTQLFKNGIIEAVNTSYLKDDAERKIIPSQAIERYILKAYQNYQKLLSELEIQSPIIVSLSLLGIKGYEFAVGGNYFGMERKFPHSKDILNLPENLISDLQEDISSVFKPIFDSLWNAYGHKESENFDDEGRWNPRN